MSIVLLTSVVTDIELHWTTSSVSGIATDHIAYVNDPSETIPGTPTHAPWLVVSPTVAMNLGVIAGVYYHTGETLNGLFVYTWQPTLTPDLV